MRVGGRGPESDWERAWRVRYEAPEPSKTRKRAGSRRAPGSHLLVATAVLAVLVTSAAFAGSGDDRKVSAARGKGDPVALGKRSPRSGSVKSETAIVAKKGDDERALRVENKSSSGRALSATCTNDGTSAGHACAGFINKGEGPAARFKTAGEVPFVLRDTNTGLVKYLNADRVDGRDASEFLLDSDASSFLGATAKAADSETLDGQDSSSFLGATAKANDSDTLDGMNSSEFLGATAKAADADMLDGKDSLSYARLGGAVFTDGDPAGVGFTSEETSTGVYRVDFPAGTFKTATSCKTPVPIVVAHSDTAVIATVAIGMATCNASDGSGGFTAKMFTHAGAATESAFWFMVL